MSALVALDKAVPTCGHFRHWNDGIVDPGTGDWETCDECGRLVCFDVSCDNSWQWSEDGAVVGYHHQKGVDTC